MTQHTDILAIAAASGYANVSFPLPTNRPLTPSLSPSDGERVAEGRVRGGSWSQCVRKSERGLPMNPGGDFPELCARVAPMNGGARLRRALISQRQKIRARRSLAPPGSWSGEGEGS